MMNLQHIHEFCNNMRSLYGAGFIQNPVVNGVKFVGEYLAVSGQVLSVIIDVYNNRGEIKIFDQAQRLIFNDKFTGNINNVTKISNFIQKSRVQN
jgi:hypothetical protein